jgi:succinylarginine dihydrolase
MKAFEVNFDGLVGPTHNYAGLAFGNVASSAHQFQASNPRAAALQGLAKMRILHQLGLKQGIIPPQARPHWDFLKSIGFDGSPEAILKKVYQTHPELLSAAYSASSMWAANAATVSPSADTADKKVHFTAANLQSNTHRFLECEMTARYLKQIFKSPEHFVHHDPLPAQSCFKDEGAANHNRLCAAHGEAGIEVFVYGEDPFDGPHNAHHFPRRQSKAACLAHARNHQLHHDKVVFAQQHPDAIDKGVFHNDVISLANESVFLFHEHAFVETDKVIRVIQEKYNGNLSAIKVLERDLSLTDAVQSYLFNSQLVTLDDGGMQLIAPEECLSVAAASKVIQQLLDADNPIKGVHYVDCRQSMQNGGGPACLRLRVVLTEHEWAHCHPGVKFNDDLYDALVDWVKAHYRDTIEVDDLLDPQLAVESARALAALEGILKLN